MVTRFTDPRSELTEREQQVAKLAAEGLLNKEIARELWVTEHTVRFHLRNVYDKLRVRNRAQLTSLWIRGRRFEDSEVARY